LDAFLLKDSMADGAQAKNMEVRMILVGREEVT
jgi:hypothetical protein